MNYYVQKYNSWPSHYKTCSMKYLSQQWIFEDKECLYEGQDRSRPQYLWGQCPWCPWRYKEAMIPSHWPNITSSVHECCCHYCTTYCALHTGCTGWYFPGLSGFETAEFTHTKDRGHCDAGTFLVILSISIFLPDRYLARRSTYCQIILGNEESDLSEEGSKYRGYHHIQDVIQPWKVTASKM